MPSSSSPTHGLAEVDLLACSLTCPFNNQLIVRRTLPRPQSNGSTTHRPSHQAVQSCLRHRRHTTASWIRTRGCSIVRAPHCQYTQLGQPTPEPVACRRQGRWLQAHACLRLMCKRVTDVLRHRYAVVRQTPVKPTRGLGLRPSGCAFYLWHSCTLPLHLHSPARARRGRCIYQYYWRVA